jgi:hypothetical protein
MIQASRVMGETYAGSVGRVKRVRSALGLVVVGLLVVLAPGCAGDSSAGSTAGSGTRAEGSALPAVDVVNVGSGGSVSLPSLLPGTKPLLVWFWAPH